MDDIVNGVNDDFEGPPEPPPPLRRPAASQQPAASQRTAAKAGASKVHSYGGRRPRYCDGIGVRLLVALFGSCAERFAAQARHVR